MVSGRLLIILMIAGLLLAGCGSADNPVPPPTPVSEIELVRAITLPPTWTPEPTLTRAPTHPPATIAPRPTATLYIIPTYTPFPNSRDYPVITAENAAQLVTLVEKDQSLYDVSWGADGSLAAAMKDGVRVYPAFNLSATPRLLRDVDPERLAYKTASVALSADGQTVATGNAYGEVRIWDLAAQRERFVLPDHSFDVTDLVFGPDGTTLYAASFERVIRVWNAQTGEALGTISLGDGLTPYRLALHPARPLLLATSVASARFYAWDLQTGDLLITRSAAKNAIGLALSADGQWLAYPNRRVVSVWAFDAVLEPDGEPEDLLEHNSEIWELAFSPDGRLLAVGLADGTVYLWDRAAAKQVAVLRAGDSLIRVLSFSPDGKFLVTSSALGGWSVWGAQ